MRELSRTFRVDQTPERTAAYVGDLATSAEWDPHTRSCVQLDDRPVGVGTRYDVVRHLAGFDAELRCEVVEFVPGQRVRLRGEGAMMHTDELIEFRADGEQTLITWTVRVDLTGVARHGERFVPAMLNAVADDGTAALRARLEALG